MQLPKDPRLWPDIQEWIRGALPEKAPPEADTEIPPDLDFWGMCRRWNDNKPTTKPQPPQ